MATKRVIFPTLQETLFLQERLIQEFGGMLGVRDLGLLESALMRPQSGYYKSLSEQAAALFQSLATNHCFVDGNKRVAFALTKVFLLMNGATLTVNAAEGYRFIVKEIIEGKADVNLIAAWLEFRMK